MIIRIFFVTILFFSSCAFSFNNTKWVCKKHNEIDVLGDGSINEYGKLNQTILIEITDTKIIYENIDIGQTDEIKVVVINDMGVMGVSNHTGVWSNEVHIDGAWSSNQFYFNGYNFKIVLGAIQMKDDLSQNIKEGDVWSSTTYGTCKKR